MLWLFYSQDRSQVPILTEAGWSTVPVWTDVEKRKSDTLLRWLLTHVTELQALRVCMVFQFVFKQHVAGLIVMGDIWLCVIWLVCDLFKHSIIVHVLISSLFFIYSRLSSCVEALQSILYPFSWQHTLIPVLPTSLFDICLSPTPYIVGILRGRDTAAVPGPIEEVRCLICPLTRILRLCETSHLSSVPRSSGCHVTWDVSE